MEIESDAKDDGRNVFSHLHEKMRIKEGDDDRTVLSKKLSFVLRHGAKQLDFNIDDEGYVSVSELLQCGELFEGVTMEALMQAIDESNKDKQRYELRQQEDGEYLMRATGKHTMQGLSERPAREKKQRRGSGKEGSSSGGRSPKHNGSGITPSPGGQQLSEEEFCAKWSLDRLARMRLSELPPASRRLAMQRFNPGPQVPAGDFPKVFVAFCKRFRKDKEDGGFDDLDLEDSSPNISPTASLGGGKSAKSKKKGAKLADHSNTIRGQQAGLDEDSEATRKVYAPQNGLLLHSTDVAEGSPYLDRYRSPGSSPRSDMGDHSPVALPLHCLRPQALPTGPLPMQAPGSPLSPSHAPGVIRASPVTAQLPQSPGLVSPQYHRPPASPPRAPPPPAYAPDTLLSTSASNVPPPPMHAPQVHGLIAANTGHSGHRYHRQQELRLQPPPGQFSTTPSGYRNVYDRPDHLAFHPGGDTYQAYHRNFPRSDGWQVPAGNEHGACY